MCCFKSHSLWSFVPVTLGNKHSPQTFPESLLELEALRSVHGGEERTKEMQRTVFFFFFFTFRHSESGSIVRNLSDAPIPFTGLSTFQNSS